jgi:sec-independent protein translocase protein TatA
MPGFIGLPEMIVLGLVVLLVFGPKRLPEMGRSLGRGMREFKDSVTGGDRDGGDVRLEGAPLQPAAVETARVSEREAA